MSTYNENVIAEIRVHIERLKDKYSHSTVDKAFEHWAVRSILPDITEDVSCDIVEVGGPNDNGIDGFTKEISEDRTTRIFQMKYTSDNPLQESFGADILDSIDRSIDCLNEGETEGIRNATLRTHIIEYQEAIRDSHAIIFYFVIFGKLTDDGKRVLNIKTRHLQKQNIALELINIENLYKIHLENMSKESEDRLTEEVSLDISPEDFFCISMNHRTDAYIAVIKASFFADLFDRFKFKLFDLNVRYGLALNDAKRNMIATLDEGEEKKYFLAYNNGLTIICEDCRYDDNNNKLIIKGPQIVNGCQTTLTLAENRLKLDDSVKILTRIIPSIEEDFSQKIAQNNNTQNQVSFRDLMSNEESQKLLQQRFNLLTPRWKYIRKRGEWKRLRQREKNQFRNTANLQDSNLKSYLLKYDLIERRVDNDKIASYYLAFSGKPTQSRTENKKLFMTTGGFYREIFNPSRSAEELLFPILLSNGIIYAEKQKFLTDYALIEPTYSSLPEADKKMWFGRSVVKYAQYHILGLMGEIIRMKYSAFNAEIAKELLESDLIELSAELYKLVIGNLKPQVISLDPTNTDLSSEFKKDDLYINALATIKDKIMDNNNILDFLPD